MGSAECGMGNEQVSQWRNSVFAIGLHECGLALGIAEGEFLTRSLENR
jgi:hypothetical protein